MRSGGLCTPILSAGLLLALALDASTPAATPALPRPVPLGAIENSFQLGENLYSGGAPESAADFAALRRQGIRTILSVDGVMPDATAAREHGLRYVHLPIGYGRIESTNQLGILAAAGTLEGPLFVHCHHGRHRGPAAAALIAMQQEGWSPARALQWLSLAGTDPEYTGLYQSVREFEPATGAALQAVGSDFPQGRKPDGLVEAMIAIDRTWENLKSLSKAPGNSPEPLRAELKLLSELFRESARLPEARRHGESFVDALNSAARQVEEHRISPLHKGPAPGFVAFQDACRTCHHRYRD